MIALAMFFGCTQISGAAAGDLLIESGTDEHKTLATGWLQVNLGIGDTRAMCLP